MEDDRRHTEGCRVGCLPAKANGSAQIDSHNSSREIKFMYFGLPILLVLLLLFLIAPVYVSESESNPKFVVQVESFATSSSFNITNSTITGDWNLTLSINNKRSDSTHQHVEVNIYYNSEYISGTMLAPFKLPSHGRTLLNATIAAFSRKISNHTANALRRSPPIPTVELHTEVTLTDGDNGYLGSCVMTAKCGNMTAGRTSGPSKCNISYLKP